ncbi:uncharacterized protein BDW43DRAFT_286452 [Aspergillus alliaceus]|uniref:uncharacterized protein n=1 Tax=Petromyces alliaceus TaxID=209559 RepID=UPI0012A49D38|nr:uncharacterized protein BDW43DRAFT_286452 [Aspergillus alliaceus]KAB8230192.1 hypothetical protein BDW43DRAFT_286452 [Aspergillus alliaceus]
MCVSPKLIFSMLVGKEAGGQEGEVGSKAQTHGQSFVPGLSAGKCARGAATLGFGRGQESWGHRIKSRSSHQ